MGRRPRCSKDGLNKGAWTALEDKTLTDYVKIHGQGKWSNVAKATGLKRCGKSCRLRWMNYLRPDIKRGNISDDEEELIIRLHKLLGNRWSLIAGRLPGRTDNEIKNFWNTNLAKKAQELHSEKKAMVRTANEAPPEISRTDANAVQGTGVYASLEQQNVLDHNNNNVPAGPILTGNLLKITTNDTESSNGTPLLMSGKENSSDFMMDFDMDDFCKIFDSDFKKLSDIHINHANNVMEADGDINGCKSKMSSPEKLVKNWSGSDCVQADMNSDFLSLASSFLESAEEWPGDGLNIIHSD